VRVGRPPEKGHLEFLFFILERININSNCDNVKLQNDSVTLTFEVGTQFLDMTHFLDMVDICAMLFQNPQCMTKLQP
jgi:hypothetical protein